MIRGTRMLRGKPCFLQCDTVDRIWQVHIFLSTFQAGIPRVIVQIDLAKAQLPLGVAMAPLQLISLKVCKLLQKNELIWHLVLVL